MATGFFIVPMEGVDLRGDGNIFWSPRYWRGFPVTRWASIEYSRESIAMVSYEATQAHIDFINAQSDTTFLTMEPDLLENVGGSKRTTVTNALEPLGIPMNWLSASDSNREMLRVIAGILLFGQKHFKVNGLPFFDDLELQGFGLNTQWQNLSSSIQSTINNTITSKGWNIIPSPTEQVRNLLKLFSEEFSTDIFYFNGVEI